MTEISKILEEVINNSHGLPEPNAVAKAEAKLQALFKSAAPEKKHEKGCYATNYNQCTCKHRLANQAIDTMLNNIGGSDNVKE